MEYILIMFIGGTNHSSTIVAEFNAMESCIRAGEEMIENIQKVSSWERIAWTCAGK